MGTRWLGWFVWLVGFEDGEDEDKTAGDDAETAPPFWHFSEKMAEDDAATAPLSHNPRTTFSYLEASCK